MTVSGHDSPARQAVVTGLAVAGFVALVTLGIWFAVYSTRFVPQVVGDIGSAAVYLGSVFTPSPEPSLSVVPVASTTIPFDEASSTISTTVTDVSTTPGTKASVTPLPTTAGEKTSDTYQIAGTSTPSLYGFPDFVTHINAVGYLATSSADSFVASTTVPAGGRAAVSFTIKNVGTNVSGPWRFSASIPTQTAYIFQSQPQQSLNPGDSIDFTLGFDQATPGTGKTISITANFDHAVTESNPDNDSASAQITILGS
ncbi:MAG: hypothetical protein ACYC48_01170 [Minisyncoccota bacterium]